MNRINFRESLKAKSPPPGLHRVLEALWYAGKGDWTKAHECAQEVDDKDGAWVHAYLHRQEGDLANAGYWYHRAAKPTATSSFQEEWESIFESLVPDQG